MSSLNWLDAAKMLKAYQSNSRALLKSPPNGADILKGFTVQKSDIEAIMSNSDVEDVFVMPAVNLDDLTKPEAEQSFTVVLAGLDVNGDIVENSAVDFAAPCPVSCPKNYPK